MMTPKNVYVYILRCNDDSFYTGITKNPDLRLKQHNSGTEQRLQKRTRNRKELIISKYGKEVLAS
jgi:putative endonuclease